MIYIFWTCKDSGEAKRILRDLIEKQLVACASIFPVESVYRWAGKIEESMETKVILKTQEIHFESISNYIQSQCSYEVPEIVQVNIQKGSLRYLQWVLDSTSPDA